MTDPHLNPTDTTSTPQPRSLWIEVLATGLGGGLSPWAPGTAGTITAAIFYGGFMRGWNPWGYAAFLIPFIIASCYIAHRAEPIYGKRDPGQITIDEWAGFFVTMFPLGGVYRSFWSSLLVGFFVFRILDILKPSPCRRIDLMKNGGFSVVMDDVMAGVYGCAILTGFRALGWLA